MKRTIVAFFLLSCALIIPSLASATQIKAYIAEFTVAPAEASGLKSILQTLLSSRMASDSIAPVAAASEADVIISGSYTQFGKVFSLDAVAKLPAGKTLTTVFEQGESQDDLIPAIGRISAKLKSETLQRYPQAIQAAAAAPVAPVAPQAAPPAALPVGSTIWLSPRIKNAQMGLASAGGRADGREFLVAETHALRVYKQEKTLKLLTEVSFPLREKVISIDSVGPDQSGATRVFVTIMDGESPASKIFTYQGGQLKLVAGKLPYLFRALALSGGPTKVYVQEMSTGEDFFGDVYEMPLSGTSFEKKNPIKMPRYANIFNYNTVTGPDGKNFPTALSTDGHLVIYSDTLEELWRSNEKFGGSETFFQRETGANVKDTYDKYRWRFIDQRITVTPAGTIIVPQNAGFFVLGNNRSYSKYSVVAFSWNGSSAEELWRTKQSQNYLADYYYAPEARELVLLEVVQKEGAFSTGGSTVRVIRAE
jgi:hypothetical protein